MRDNLLFGAKIIAKSRSIKYSDTLRRRGWPGALERRCPNGSVMALARQLRCAPPSPVATIASIFSTLIRGPIGRRHRIYYNLQRIFRWGTLLLLSPPRRISPNDMRRCITEQGIVWGKEVRGGESGGAGECGKEEMAVK